MKHVISQTKAKMVKTLLVSIGYRVYADTLDKVREGGLTDSSFVCRFVALIESELIKPLTKVVCV